MFVFCRVLKQACKLNIECPQSVTDQVSSRPFDAAPGTKRPMKTMKKKTEADPKEEKAAKKAKKTKKDKESKAPAKKGKETSNAKPIKRPAAATVEQPPAKQKAMKSKKETPDKDTDADEDIPMISGLATTATPHSGCNPG